MEFKCGARYGLYVVLSSPESKGKADEVGDSASVRIDGAVQQGYRSLGCSEGVPELNDTPKCGEGPTTWSARQGQMERLGRFQRHEGSETPR
jgi:hypothetical protein